MKTQDNTTIQDSITLIGQKCTICEYPCGGAISLFKDKNNYICDNDSCIHEYKDLKKKNVLGSFYKDKNQTN